MDHYKTLGVDRNASPDEIKKAYRKLAGQHHPDRGGDTATFQKIEEAYRILSDPNQRQQYDAPNPFGGQGMPGFNGFPGGFSFNVNGFDINDILGGMFRHQQNQKPVYRTTVVVTLDQVYAGEDQVLKLQTPNGLKVVNVQVPKGIEDGSQIRYDNLIDNASLIVEYRIQPHLKFERRGADLTANQSISVLDLIVGTTIEFETISGKTFQVTVPPKTQPHMNLRITGQGMPVYGSPHYGDQIILLKPFIPDNIDSAIIDSILRSRNS